MIDQATLDLCAKLYSLADPKRGASPEESHTAWTKLHELLAKHQISIDQVISAANASSRRRPDHPAYKEHDRREAERRHAENSFWNPPPPPRRPKDTTSSAGSSSSSSHRAKSWHDLPGFAPGPAATYDDGHWSMHGAFALWLFTPKPKRPDLAHDPNSYKFYGEPTDKQLHALYRFGVSPQTVRTKAAASRVIGLFMERKDRSLATVNQVCELAKLTQFPLDDVAADNLSYDMAATLIRKAHENQPF